MTLESIAVARKRAYPPRVSAFTQPFWDGLAKGQWQSTCCEACGKFTFPPKPICPHCWSDKMTWKDLSRRGTLYSWTRVHSAPKVFTDEAPYALCVVDLDIGLRIATRMVRGQDTPADGTFKIGMPMEVIVLNFEDGPLFASRPSSPG
jgi:uncharacterized OB-fold protein